RQFLQTATSLALVSLPATAADTLRKSSFVADGEYTKVVSLNGVWQFRLDPGNVGQTNAWYKSNQVSDGWQNVTVPHTWQVSQDSADYFGAAWYRRRLEVPNDWTHQTVRIEFEAVFHSAWVWLSGSEVGHHLRKGYTAFQFDITRFLQPGAENVLVVM